MKRIATVLCGFLVLAACNAEQPELKSFKWSRDSYPPPGFSTFNEPFAPATSKSNLVTVWTTTYSRQDMSKARGWLQINPSEIVLCFAAPDYPPSPTPDGDAEASAAYPALLTFELSNTRNGSNIKFSDECTGR
jgi:hypothetical protein